VAFRLERVVPWGRRLAEYRRMFDLRAADLARGVLDIGGGPASFTAEIARDGIRALAVDPLYAAAPEAIRRRFRATKDEVLAQAAANREAYRWEEIPSVAALGAARTEALETFLADFAAPEGRRRYAAGALPHLPFAAGSAGLALCSHLLFTYSAALGEDFHLAALRELCRVAAVVRVFPLVTMASEPSPLVAPLRRALRREGYAARIREVPYEFQRGGNQMMEVTAA
jgi:SAM-dependent methyltransferase